MNVTPEPMDELDAMTRTPAAAAGGPGLVNGPEDGFPDWYEIDWDQAEDDVRRLRQRIFAASQAGDLARVRNLQKLVLRSRANAQVGVRRVAEVNAGRKTAGIGGRTALLAVQKAELAARVQQGPGSWKPGPVKRVYIPKANGKKRGLGIPVMMDRALQAVAVNALEPEWEARFEARSYGFRPGRSCQDAIAAIFWTTAGTRTKRRWALDADLSAAFDRADHAHILRQPGTFPARGMVAAWLKAGVIDQGRFAPTEEGTPQGGVISPLIFNVVLHGMEQAAGAAYRWNPYRESEESVPGTPVLIRYADLSRTRDKSAYADVRVMPRWLGSGGAAVAGPPRFARCRGCRAAAR
jgi:RNA-directed DNA polymerase